MVTPTEIRANFNESRQLEGNLRVFKFPEVLQFLAMGKMSGALTLTHDGREARLVFSEGKIINVASDERYMSLGQMLLSTGRLSRRELEEALEVQQRSVKEKFLGEILLEKGMIDTAELQNVIRLQIEEELWEFFSWDSGQFKFEQGHFHDTGPVRVEMDVTVILQEGTRRMEEWRVLCERINNPKECLIPNAEFAGLHDQQLNEKTWKVLSLVNGRLNIESIVRLSGLGKFETYYALDRLLHNEVIARPPSNPEAAGVATAAPVAEPGEGHEADRKIDIQGHEAAKGGLRGLFARKKAPKADRMATEEDLDATIHPSLSFDTDMGLVCAAVNHMIEIVNTEAPAMIRAEPKWVENIWKFVEQRHVRADFMRVHDGRLDPVLYERYARLESRITKALNGLHDDGLEALRNFWSQTIEKVSAFTRDSQAGQDLADRATRPFIGCAARICNPDFSFMQWREEGFQTKTSTLATFVRE